MSDLTPCNSGDIIRVITPLISRLSWKSTVSVGENIEHNGRLPRRLRVVEWISMVPAIAICTACAERFTVPVAALSRAMAQANLQYQFDRHECKRSQATAS